MTNEDIDDLIDMVSGRSGSGYCKTCADEWLSRAVQRWLERRAAGETLPGLDPMHKQLFLKKSKEKPSASAIRRHITSCLGLDYNTGLPLEKNDG